MIASGTADRVDATSGDAASSTTHRDLARRVATRGAVLLKNAAGSLPLDEKVRSIAVVGPCGLDAIYVMGGSASVPLEEHRRFLELTAERLEHLHVVDGQIRESSERRSLEEVQDDLWGIVGAIRPT